MVMADATILVVDDEPELLEIFAIWLKRRGATVLKAANGADALKILATHKVNVMISDMRMPIMDGVTLVRSLHDLHLEFPTTIFVSGFSDVSPRVLYGLGVEAMLPKPLGRSQLLGALESSLRERDELWLQPLPEPADRTLSLEFESLEAAARTHAFSLGRGGCCLQAPKMMPESTVDLHLHFKEDNLLLLGQGIVRWWDPKTEHIGLEFCYLDPATRAWVHTRTDHVEMQAFIPFC